MLPRAANKIETTLLPSSSATARQRLPRPARFISTRHVSHTIPPPPKRDYPTPSKRDYSTPSKRANAPAFAQAQLSLPTPEYPAFLNTPKSRVQIQEDAGSPLHDMQGFLRRRTPYTILPTPLPDDTHSPLNAFWFPDSPTQDLLAVMDACLHNLYDVPRAKQVFEGLRRDRAGDPILEGRLYNSFLESFLGMAEREEGGGRERWVEEVVSLWRVMESGEEKVGPSGSTYAIMMRVWQKFGPNSANPHPHPLPSPIDLLSSLDRNQGSIATVISDRAFTTSESAAEAIQLFSKAAMDLGISRIVRELGSVEAMGRVPDELEDVPEVLPVTRMVKQETGEGGETALVEEIPFNLSSLRKHLAQVNLSRRVLTTDLASRQKFLEESVYTVAVERMKREAEHFDELGLGGEMDKAMKSERLQKWMWEWHGKLMERLKVDIEGVIEKEKSCTERQMVHRLGPFLSLLKPEKLSLITILELMRLHGTGGVSDGMKTARALLAVGRAVELEYKATLCRRAKISIPSTISALSSGTGRPGEAGYFSGRAYEDLYKRRVAARRWVEDGEEWAGEWTQVGRVKVGSFLVDCLMDVAVVERKGIDKRTGQEVRENQPAFFHSYEYLHGHKLGVIKLNQVVAERLAKDGLRDTLHPRHLPMLIKPKPWLSHTDGGYLYNKTVAMRFKDSMEQESYLKHASSLGNLELVYAGLDVLGSTPWKINRGVFDVVLQVWNKGDRMGKIPPAVYDAPEPEPIEGMECDPKSKNVFMQRQKAWAHGKANNHSDRCSVNYRIEIARAFLGDTFYLPHNIDFRGRAYPIPPHLNHIGDDLSRGLLMFGEAKPLGERGLKWLKIHLANLYGYDKGSFDDRVVFVNERLEEIFDSAEKPLEGKGWWKKADDPWQCLAACKELHAALNSPDPLAYECALPVHQDGTCNGLQHYAALGGDEQGAKQVNLDVTDRPSDVYTYVAQMVEKRMLADIEKGDGGSAKFAKMLSGKVSRKVVKQTVMTTVYGVTFIGARDQIEKQLKDRGDLPEEECWLAASYLAKQVLLCIGNLFAGAKDIQNWLNLCARLISKSIPPERLEEAMSENVPQVKKGRVPKKIPVSRLRKEQMTSVVWTTPMGLPIVQPYRKTKRKQIMTALQTVFISDPNTPSEVNAVKQASAFPPNFIHSLDATHMMLTALQCRTRGLIFASVHDSYWTHACSVDEMSGIIRDTFIALHSSDVLRRLHAEFIERYKGYKIPLVSLKAGNLFKHVRASPSVPLSPETLEALAGEEATLDLSVSDRDVVVEDGDDVDALMEMEAEEEEEEEKPKGKKRGRKPKFDESMSDAMIAGKFVDLADVLPPLPEKGNFDVNTIKRSLYFFS